MFQSEYLNSFKFTPKSWQSFQKALKVLSIFVMRLILAGMPIIVYITYPVIFQPYEYFATTFFAWAFAGIVFAFATAFFYSAGDKFRKNNDLALTFHNLILVVIWSLSLFFLSVTDNLYTNGKHLKLEQDGHCDLVHASDQGGCNARKSSIIANSGIFKIVSGNLGGDKTCSLSLSETLPSGMFRITTLNANASLCEKLKIGDRIKLSSRLIEHQSHCAGNVKKYSTFDSVEANTSTKTNMKIDVCTTYELMPN